MAAARTLARQRAVYEVSRYPPVCLFNTRTAGRHFAVSDSLRSLRPSQWMGALVAVVAAFCGSVSVLSLCLPYLRPRGERVAGGGTAEGWEIARLWSADTLRCVAIPCGARASRRGGSCSAAGWACGRSGNSPRSSCKSSWTTSLAQRAAG